MTTYDTPLFPARNADPATSKAAAADDTGRDVLRMRLLWAFTAEERLAERFRLKPRGLTRDEAAVWASLPATSNTSRRLSDLKDLGYIKATGSTRLGESGRHQTVWRLTSEGWTEARKQ